MCLLAEASPAYFYLEARGVHGFSSDGTDEISATDPMLKQDEDTPPPKVKSESYKTFPGSMTEVGRDQSKSVAREGLPSYVSRPDHSFQPLLETSR